MDKIFLRYRDKQIQKDYDMFNDCDFNQIFKGYSIFYSIIYFLYSIESFIVQDVKKPLFIIIIRIVQCVITIMFFFLFRNRVSILKYYFVFAMGLANVILIVEKQQFIEDYNNFQSFCDGIVLALHLLITIIILQNQYIMSFVLIIFCMVLMVVRIQQFSMKQFIYEMIRTFLTFILLFSFIKQKMINYLEFYNNQKQLKSLKSIIQTQVPFNMIILEKIQEPEKIKINFINTKLIQLLANYQIISQHLIQQENSFELIGQRLESLQVFYEHNDQQKQINFFQLLIQQVQSNSKDKIIFQFQKDHDYVIGKECINEVVFKTYYSLKIYDCKWEEQPSILVVIKNASSKTAVPQLQKINKCKDEMLANVTHDLKTPINGMIAQIDSVNDKQLPQQHQSLSQQKQNYEDIKRVLQIVKINIKLLLFLIYDIQDYSQIIQNKIKIVTDIFNLKQIIQECIQLIEFQAKQKNIKLIVDIKESLNETDISINNDQIRLKQIIINLLSNALKCTKKGFIKIIVEESVTMSNTVKISVQDTGIGISPIHQQTLFEKYSSFHNDKNQHGVGLGLSITRHLIGLIGPKEELEVQSEVDVGSTFSFYIFKNQQSFCQLTSFAIESHNLIQSENALQIGESIQNIQFEEHVSINQIYKENYQIRKYLQMSKNQKLNCLAVDDDIFCILALKQITQQYPHIKIQEASDGQTAIEYATNNKYDIAFLDINMPIMNGIDLAMNLKKLQNNIIIVLLSGCNEFEEHQLDFKFYTLEKPVTRDKFAQIMMNFKQQ